VCSHCSSGFHSGTTRVKAARGGGGAGDDWRRGERRRGRHGDGDFGFGPTVVESVGAAGWEEGGGVKRREREGGREEGREEERLRIRGRKGGEGGREGRKGLRTTDVSGDGVLLMFIVGEIGVYVYVW